MFAYSYPPQRDRQTDISIDMTITLPRIPHSYWGGVIITEGSILSRAVHPLMIHRHSVGIYERLEGWINPCNVS